jgi:hypothetical protein
MPLLALRYGLPNLLLACFTLALGLGAWWIVPAHGLAMALGGPLDEITAEGGSRLDSKWAWYFDLNLFATLPLIIAMTLLYWRHIATIDLRVVALWSPEFAYLVLATFGVAYFYALAGATVAHELIHRTDSTVAQVVGHALYAFTLVPALPIAHVYGHHRKVGLYGDPSTARRGEYVLAFVARCTFGQLAESFAIEAARLRRKGAKPMSLENRALCAQGYMLVVLFAAMAIAGWPGLAASLVAGSLGRTLNSLVDYVQHYGLVRVEGAPIEARHAWDCHRSLTNSLQYNLARHADHHKFGGKPFWQLELISGAPALPYGYQMAAVVALIPPLWSRTIDPLLAKWDREMATDDERALVERIASKSVT